MKKFLDEFKAFALKGNVMDLAVGVIIGTAFGAITTSLINDILMPLIGVIVGGIDFSGLAVTVGGASIAYGSFITAIINFLLIAFVVFWLVKAMNKLTAKKEEAPAAPPEPSAEEKLLTEIRDLLKERK
ncbi:MAG: large-conductance mechanosensitive channel protein MscL [Ruminococcaceae bacterium]|jgi:large conductance mechanosensitive channel|nr:large-conductance mechanosensitive channel protein MscL [Oscillospiraceae bacterium]